jgi:RNA polymerase sigma-70 factor (ECF subfamily)
MMAYIVSIVCDDHLAEDIFQEVCALAYQKREKINDETHLMGWLRITARQESLKALRRQSTHQLAFDSSLLDLMEGHWEKYDHPEIPEKIRALRRCLNKLTPNARNIINLRYVEGISGAKLAETLNRKLNTVYVALARIHRNLAECIHRQLGGAQEVTNG